MNNTTGQSAHQVFQNKVTVTSILIKKVEIAGTTTLM